MRVLVWHGAQGVWNRKELCGLLYASSNQEASILSQQLVHSTFHPLLGPHLAL